MSRKSKAGASIVVPSDKPMLLGANGEPLDGKKAGTFYEDIPGASADQRLDEMDHWRGKETDVWLAVYVVRGGKPAPLEGNIGQAIHIPSDFFQNQGKQRYIADWTATVAYDALKKAGL